MGVLQQTPTPHRHRSCYQSITERGLCRTHHSTLLSTAKMKHLLLVSLVTPASLPSLLARPPVQVRPGGRGLGAVRGRRGGELPRGGLLRAVERNQGDHLGCHHLHQARVRKWRRDNQVATGHWPPTQLFSSTR